MEGLIPNGKWCEEYSYSVISQGSSSDALFALLLTHEGGTWGGHLANGQHTTNDNTAYMTPNMTINCDHWSDGSNGEPNNIESINNTINYLKNNPPPPDQCYIAVQLPLKLISFDVKIKDNCHAVLKWISGEEINTEYIIVEESPDATTFYSIDTILPQGSNSQYQYNIFNHDGREHYYRLKITDFDGIWEYSDIISIPACENKEIVIYPNPADDILYIAGWIKYSIYSIQGQLIKTWVLNGGSIDIKDLHSGLYIVRVTGIDGHKENVKFLKL